MIFRLKPYLTGLVIIIFAQWLLETQTETLRGWFDLLKWSGYGLLVLTLVVSVHFNRPVYAHFMVLVGIQYYLIQNFLQVPLSEPSAQVLYLWLAIWLPLSALLVSVVPAKPIKHWFQALVACVYLAPLLGVIALLDSISVWYSEFLASGAAPDLLFQFWPSDWLVSSVGVVIFYLMCLLIGLTLVRFNKALTLLPLMILLQAVLLMRFHLTFASAVMFLAGMLIVFVYLLQQSWQLVYLDELTGLPGRRAMNETLQGLGRRYTLAMMDVDHFKKFNDTYGHDIGDQVLKMVASRIGEVGGGGKPFRYGGEEFAIVFPGKALGETLVHLETVRTAIENYQMTIRQSDRPEDNVEGKKKRAVKVAESTKVVSVTISIGAAERVQGEKDPNDVLKNADKVLYQAKEAGRNCVCY